MWRKQQTLKPNICVDNDDAAAGDDDEDNVYILPVK